MTTPAFIDRLIKEVSINVQNIAVPGGSSWDSSSATMDVNLDTSFIATPDVGSIVMANANMMVKSSGFVINRATSYNTASANMLVANNSYGDYNVALYVEGSKLPVITNIAAITVSPQPIRVYWS